MKTITKKINLYKFKELNKEKQGKLINEYIQTTIEFTNIDNLAKNSNLYKAIKKADEMLTPWFLADIYYHDYKGKEKAINELNKFYFDNELNYYKK